MVVNIANDNAIVTKIILAQRIAIVVPVLRKPPCAATKNNLFKRGIFRVHIVIMALNDIPLEDLRAVLVEQPVNWPTVDGSTSQSPRSTVLSS